MRDIQTLSGCALLTGYATQLPKKRRVTPLDVAARAARWAKFTEKCIKQGQKLIKDYMVRLRPCCHAPLQRARLGCRGPLLSKHIPHSLAAPTHPPFPCRTLQERDDDPDSAVVAVVDCGLGWEATVAALQALPLDVELFGDGKFVALPKGPDYFSASDDDCDDDDDEDAGSAGGGGGGAIAGAAAVVQDPDVVVISDDDEMEAAPAAGALSFVASLHRPLRPANPPLPALAPAVRSSASLPVCVQSGNVAAADTSTTRNVL